MLHKFHSHPLQTRLLMAVLVLLALSGIAGGLAMIRDTSAAGFLHLSPTLLEHAPVHSYFWPGMFLIGVFGIIPLATALELWVGERHAWTAAFGIGVILAAWMTYEILVIDFHPLQLLYFAIAFIIMGLALSSRQ